LKNLDIIVEIKDEFIRYETTQKALNHDKLFKLTWVLSIYL